MHVGYERSLWDLSFQVKSFKIICFLNRNQENDELK